jgi:hypothetical protein
VALGLLLGLLLVLLAAWGKRRLKPDMAKSEDLPANVTREPDESWPTRSVPGGWRDDWEADDVAAVAAELAAFNDATTTVAAEWNAEQHQDRQRPERERRRRPS